MLEQILMHLNNWFLVPDGVREDTYTIEDGSIVLPFLIEGQYFRVIGSVFNDGLHQYPSLDMIRSDTSQLYLRGAPPPELWIKKLPLPASFRFQMPLMLLVTVP